MWKFRIRELFAELDVLKVVDELVPNEVDETWKKAEKRAKSILVQHLSDSFLHYAADNISARALLQKLDAIYERRSLASQLAAHKRLVTLKLLSETTLSSHFVKFDDIVSDILAAGGKLAEMERVMYLLHTLPSTYDGVITAIETLSTLPL